MLSQKFDIKNSIEVIKNFIVPNEPGRISDSGCWIPQNPLEVLSFEPPTYRFLPLVAGFLKTRWRF